MPKEDPRLEGYYHNKGQEDEAEGKHEPPQTPLGGIFDNDTDTAQKAAYSKGWRHSRDQRD